MHRVVIVGGGFGGLQAALHLRRADVEITLVDRRNFHLFQPLAYQVATGALNPGEICYPLRAIFRGQENVRVVMGEVTGFDLDARELPVRTVLGEERFPYDTLIVGGGSKYNYFGHPEWQHVASELKSLEGALHIRSRILRSLEAAEVEEDPAQRAALLTFAVVGAGPTGVEMAGQIAEIARDTRRDFRLADTEKARVLLIEAGDRVLAAFPPRLSARAFRSLESLGVTPLVDRMVTDLDDESVLVRSGDGEERIPAKTIIWAAGVLAASIAGHLAAATGAKTDNVGRIVVEPDLTVEGHPEVIAIGDMVKVRSEPPYPGVAPVAMQMGRYAARLVRARLDGARAADFRYVDKGNLATIGRARAVADLKGLKLSGFFAWLMWLLIHLWYLIGFQNRLLVFLRWSISFFTHGRGARLITGDEHMP
ncbi:NAD(P)/FAD-dependent oxidoreductase [Candidatus Solirubrobacter pratensis]|uniref:NAD(P)/FAD-dependent oxidoreductase n=1 Tax=Candidatus Solirubrobacter pratensis TaxID=1298857 RepID=UPI000425D2A3|nr:NAD(P)/FAD-dependent oxidoreductase [Candidatus Solirubrobacter pratensis]